MNETSRQWIYPIDTKIDALHADGTHRYWSTHCRHAPWPRKKKKRKDETDGHDACTAAEFAPGVPRRPAQCKTCASACICPCHKET